MIRGFKNWLIRYLLQDWPKKKVQQIITAALAEKRCFGIFAGMRYVDQSIGSEYYPKLLGTYEKELHHVFEALFQKSFEQFVDIGAAEGYYAVGVALRTNWNVIAFEANPETPLPELARLNEVTERITLKGACDLGDLADALEGKPQSLLLVDVETAEFALLDPRFIPNLKTATIIVEVHDCFMHGIGDRIRSRFSQSHRIDHIDCVPRSFKDCPVSFPSLPFDPEVYTLEYMNERRPDGMYWLILTPNV
jgi:hypothetical protein